MSLEGAVMRDGRKQTERLNAFVKKMQPNNDDAGSMKLDDRIQEDGSYGAGKTSLINAFKENHPKLKIIRISSEDFAARKLLVNEEERAVGRTAGGDCHRQGLVN